MNVAVVAPDGTVTLAGVVADELSSDKVTTAPPVGAGLLRVTVPVEDPPPRSVAGFMVTDDTITGLTVSTVVWVLPLIVAVMVTGVTVATALVVTTKVAVVAPLATITLAGVVAAELLSDRVTVLCELFPVAGPFKVTVPVEELPPITEAGFMATDCTATGTIVRVAVCVTPLRLAVMVTGVEALTMLVVTVKVALA